MTPQPSERRGVAAWWALYQYHHALPCIGPDELDAIDADAVHDAAGRVAALLMQVRGQLPPLPTSDADLPPLARVRRHLAVAPTPWQCRLLVGAHAVAVQQAAPLEALRQRLEDAGAAARRAVTAVVEATAAAHARTTRPRDAAQAAQALAIASGRGVSVPAPVATGRDAALTRAVHDAVAAMSRDAHAHLAACERALVAAAASLGTFLAIVLDFCADGVVHVPPAEPDGGHLLAELRVAMGPGAFLGWITELGTSRSAGGEATAAPTAALVRAALRVVTPEDWAAADDALLLRCLSATLPLLREAAVTAGIGSVPARGRPIRP